MSATGSASNLFVVENLNVENLVKKAREKNGGHIVQNNQIETVRETLAAQMILKNPLDFFDFPLVITLSPQNPTPVLEDSLTLVERQFSTISEKEPILSEIADVLDTARLNRSLRDDVIMTANEFACNALFNAPCDLGINNRNLRTTLQSAQTQLKPAVIKVGAYQGYLAVTCLDHYGSLQPDRILGRLEKCAVLGAGESINLDDSGTAGIGCYMVLRACTSFFMGVKNGQMTQFCALFPQISRTKDRDSKSKNLHWFSI